MYHYIVNAAVFVHMVRVDHDSRAHLHTKTDHNISHLLQILEHGGILGRRRVVAGGLYNVLCRLKILSSRLGQLPALNPNEKLGIIPLEMRHALSKAERDNRDFYIITSVKRLLKDITDFLVTFKMNGTKAIEPNNRSHLFS